MVELVGGLPNGELTPIQCIYDEVLEETGYIADSIELMLVCNAVPAYSTEKLYLYYVIVSDKRNGNGGGIAEDHEYLEVVEMTKNEILKFDFQNNSDAKTLLALSLFGFVKQFYSSYRKISGLMESPDLREGGC
jgi:ADP-ribose pyrophosphatase